VRAAVFGEGSVSWDMVPDAQHQNLPNRTSYASLSLLSPPFILISFFPFKIKSLGLEILLIKTKYTT
jgi:hypothetical protein